MSTILLMMDGFLAEDIRGIDLPVPRRKNFLVD
jgi:hypothetical protein